MCEAFALLLVLAGVAKVIEWFQHRPRTSSAVYWQPPAPQPSRPVRHVRPKEKPVKRPRRKVRLVVLIKGTLSRVGLRLHCDENFPPRLARRFRRLGYTVTTTPGQRMFRALDPKQLRFATDRRAVLLTYDKDFLYWGKVEQHSGIVIGSPGAEFDEELIRVVLSM